MSRLTECQFFQKVALSSVVASEYTRSLVDPSFRASSDGSDFGFWSRNNFHIRLTRPMTIEHVSERARGRPLDVAVFTIRIKHANSLSSRCSVQLVPDEFKKITAVRIGKILKQLSPIGKLSVPLSSVSFFGSFILHPFPVSLLRQANACLIVSLSIGSIAFVLVVLTSSTVFGSHDRLYFIMER